MIHLLLTYKYWIVAPLSIIEGPILSVICGFFVTLGIFNFFIIYVIMAVGDIVGDSAIYYLGYAGKKYLKYFKVSDEKLEQAKLYFKDNHKKALITSKLVHGIGMAGIVAAGALRVPYKKFFKTCATISFIQSFILVLIGVLFGHAYVVIGKYLSDYAAIISVAFLIFLLFLFLKKKNIGIHNP
jgi:membrane protein DedA with SNARE-associated domain